VTRAGVLSQRREANVLAELRGGAGPDATAKQRPDQTEHNGLQTVTIRRCSRNMAGLVLA